MKSEQVRAKSNLTEISQLVEPRMGKLPLMGRYHKAPRKLSTDYGLTSKVLGTGLNGSVRMAKSIGSQNTHMFAVKNFNTKGMKADKLSHLHAEIEVFLCMDHPQVARLVDVYEADEKISLVMQCMAGGELFERVTKCKRFSEGSAADAIRQMLLAVSYLHSHRIVHRDLKLENFLYDTEGSTHLKLIDFGFSKFFNSKERMHTSCGTLAYVAPEVLGKSYTSQCDMWSMGVIAFILLSGHMPFYGSEHAQMREIQQGHYEMKAKDWKGVSSSGRAFVSALLRDPDKRLTARAALADAWIQEHCPDRHLNLQPVVTAFRSWILAPQLLRAVMSMMAWSLDVEQEAVVRDLFLAVDTNHDGAVSLSELKTVMVDKYGVPEIEVDAVFKVFVETHDREIHYSDFLAAMACDRIALDDDFLHATFQKFDTLGVGYITAGDFREVLGVSDARGHALVREADVLQRDGRIDYDEFVEYIRTSRLQLKGPAIKVNTKLHCSDALALTQQSLAAPTLLEAPARLRVARAVVQKPPSTRQQAFDSASSASRFFVSDDSCCSLM